MKKTVFRNVRKTKYTQVGNDLLWNKELTLQAKGLLSIFLSNSVEWEVNMKEIIKRSKNGRDAHYNIVKELIKHGYFARVEVRNKYGAFEKMEYIFSDNRKDIEKEIDSIETVFQKTEKTALIEYKDRADKNKKETLEKPHTENQDTGHGKGLKPHTENQDTENSNADNQYINKNKDNKTNLNKTNSSFEEEELNNISEKNIFFQVLNDYLKSKRIDQKTINETLNELSVRKLNNFTLESAMNQYSYMMDKIEFGEVENHNGFAVYFANGLQMRTVQSNSNKQHQIEEMEKHAERLKEAENRDTSIYFNWLEEQ